MYVHNNAVKCERKHKTTLTENIWLYWFDTLTSIYLMFVFR